MNKTFMSAMLALMLVSAVSVVSAVSGSIWTTSNQCGNDQQDVNQYSIGEKVYINGANFAEGSYDWSVKGQPGGASCDPSVVVASGSSGVDSSGAFCFEAYKVKNNDCGEYKVDFGNKKDNYHVNNVPLIPEFGLTIGVLTLLSAVGIFFFVRRK